jgi:hypothetical protein
MEGLRLKGRWEAKEDLCDSFSFDIENNARNLFRRRIASK